MGEVGYDFSKRSRPTVSRMTIARRSAITARLPGWSPVVTSALVPLIMPEFGTAKRQVTPKLKVYVNTSSQGL